tara:strand:- start:36 stop:620 length:585 start_codon:yes stop_codon:yes gene_type:complete
MAVTFHPDGRIDGFSGQSMPTGSVIQTVQGFSGTKTITNTSAHGDAPECPASVTITPSSASNKILIMFHATLIFGNGNDIGFWLLRNGTVIGNSQRTTENTVAFAVSSSNLNGYDDWKPITVAFHYLDDAQNTSAHTYTVKGSGIQGTVSNANKGLPKVAHSNGEEMVWGGSVGTSGGESNAGNMVMIAQEIKG